MNADIFTYRGGPVSISSLVNHYRKMAWREPLKARLWRMQVHAAIQAYRRDLAERAQERAAA